MTAAGGHLLQQGDGTAGGGGDGGGGGTIGADPDPDSGGGTIADLLAALGLPDWAAEVVGPTVAFLVAFVLIYAVGRAVVLPVVSRVLRSRGVSEHARKPIRRILRIVLLFAAVGAAFGFAGFTGFVTAFASVGAAATLAVGFAMQEFIANFVAGVFIYADRPFRIGDWVRWNDSEGVVEDISLRVTRVRTFDNELLTVPNSMLTNNVVTNPVAKDELRMQFLFGIAYDDDIGRAAELVREEAEAHEEILDEPAPDAHVTELADSYVGLNARFWIGDPSRSDFVRIRGEFVRSVKERFDAEGIEIPFPQRDLSGSVEAAGAATAGAEAGAGDD